MNDTKLQKLEQILTLVESDKITHAEFNSIFEQFVKVVKELKQKLELDINNSKVNLSNEVSRISNSIDYLDNKINEVNKESKQSFISNLDSHLNELRGELYSIRQSIPTLPDITPIEAKLSQIEASIPTIESDIVDKIEKDLPLLGMPIRDALEILPEGQKLEIEAIEHLREELDNLKKQLQSKSKLTLGSSTGGTTGGIGTPVDPTSGSIDGVNTTFGFAAKPTVVVIDAASYRENKGWTWNGTQVVLDTPPDYDIYGL